MKALGMWALIGMFACAPQLTRADVKLPAIFGDHMVVQRGMKVPIWGTADAGEKVTVKVAGGNEQSATADGNGGWRVSLDPMEATEPLTITVTGKNSIKIDDVLVGEVWLCSGQSNMGFKLKTAANGAEAIKAAEHPKMRLFAVAEVYKDRPQADVKGKWVVCTPETAKDFSAVAYFFGLALHKKLDVPVGLIQSSWGGTRAEAWMDRATFDRLKLPYEPQWTQEWLHPASRPNSTQPVKQRPYEAPATIYNGMIAPITGFAIRGVAWYQGETNTAYAEHYHDVLTALITNWRSTWGEGDFPFLIVQLPNFRNTRFWPIAREAQAQVARELPNTGLAVTIDIGNPATIHPTEKQTVGKRLALVAEKIAYGMDVPYAGPTFKSMKISGGDAIISFDHVYDGLVTKGDKLEGFEIAGDEGKFVPAGARIDGERVIVHADGITSPTAVRYAWANDPKCTLYNQSDLPAVPFEAKGK